MSQEEEAKKVEETLKNFSLDEEKADDDETDKEIFEDAEDNDSEEMKKEDPRDDLIDEEQLKAEEEGLTEEQLNVS